MVQKTPKQIGEEAARRAECVVRREMEKAGLGLDRGLKKLDELLECTRPISCIKGKDADGGTVDFVDVPDNPSQAKALDMLFTLGDYYPDKKIKQDLRVEGIEDILRALDARDGKKV